MSYVRTPPTPTPTRSPSPPPHNQQPLLSTPPVGCRLWLCRRLRLWSLSASRRRWSILAQITQGSGCFSFYWNVIHIDYIYIYTQYIYTQCIYICINIYTHQKRRKVHTPASPVCEALHYRAYMDGIGGMLMTTQKCIVVQMLDILHVVIYLRHGQRRARIDNCYFFLWLQHMNVCIYRDRDIDLEWRRCRYLIMYVHFPL